jgi:hypothetical protein
MAQDIVGSNLPEFASDALKESKAGYGQNGYAGASSDEPGQNTQSGFLPQPDLAGAYAKVSKADGMYKGGRSGKGNPPAPRDFKQPVFTAPQTRTVSDESYPLSFGMDARSSRKS